MYINNICSYKNILSFSQKTKRRLLLFLVGHIVWQIMCVYDCVGWWSIHHIFRHTILAVLLLLPENVQSLHANCEAIFLNMYLGKVQASKNFTQGFMNHFFLSVHPIFGMKQCLYTLSSQLNMRMTCDKKLDSFM